jgi:hypothetical protein
VQLARYGGRWGTVSRDFTHDGTYALVHGNELLGELTSAYPTILRFRVKEHTLGAIFQVLGTSAMGFPEGVAVRLPPPSAFALFAGYLLLDAVIGNTDRHHENWGVLLVGSRPRETILAPTYDHASSLGRELSDDKRSARLQARDRARGMAGYAAGSKALSAIYRVGELHPMGTFDAFLASGDFLPEAKRIWLRRLEEVQDHLLDWVGCVDNRFMSDASTRFAQELLRHNTQRLLECQP